MPSYLYFRFLRDLKSSGRLLPVEHQTNLQLSNFKTVLKLKQMVTQQIFKRLTIDIQLL